MHISRLSTTITTNLCPIHTLARSTMSFSSYVLKCRQIVPRMLYVLRCPACKEVMDLLLDRNSSFKLMRI
jgi:hypothetical protein